MKNNNRSPRGTFLLIIYFLLIGLDLIFLSNPEFYRYRVTSKPFQMFFLGYWFYINTAVRKLTPPNALSILVCTYSILILMLLSDVCSICGWNFMLAYAYYLLYIPMYIFYAILLLQVAKRTNEEKKMVFHVKQIIPSFLIVSLIAILVLWKGAGFGKEFYYWCMYFHAIVICLMGAFTINLWGFNHLPKSRILFAISVTAVIITNSTYCFDELYYHRRHHILDILVAFGNGISILFMLLGVVSAFKYWRKVELED